MRNRRLSVVGAVAIVVALAVVSVGCSNPQPSSGRNVAFVATTITNLKQNEHSGPNFWDNDNYDEPYMAHLGIRINLTGAHDGPRRGRSRPTTTTASTSASSSRARPATASPVTAPPSSRRSNRTSSS